MYLLAVLYFLKCIQGQIYRERERQFLECFAQPTNQLTNERKRRSRRRTTEMRLLSLPNYVALQFTYNARSLLYVTT